MSIIGGQVAKQEARGSQGAAMLVTVEAINALAVVCGTGPASISDAEAFICSVDPATAGVPLRQVMAALHPACQRLALWLP